SVESSNVLGSLTGVRSSQQPSGVRLFGTDLGWTFEHNGMLQIMLGDSWSKPDALCDVLTQGFPDHDDTQGYLPRRYTGGVPSITLATEPDARGEFAKTLVYRDGELLRTSQNAGPMTAFSDGQRAIAIYQATTFASCSAGTCPAPFECAPQIGQCQPPFLGVPANCDLAAENACLDGQTCEPVGAGFCVDPGVPLADVTQRVALELELAVQRPSEPTHFDSRHTFISNRFINMTARTVRRLSAYGRSDYRRGDGDLLLWGRPAFNSSEQNNQPLYLLTHKLPFTAAPSGELDFHPRYFAGVDGRGRPIWSDSQAEAKPLALDGKVDGDPRELLPVLNQLTVTWLDAPIRRWVMFYGGASPLDPNGPPTAAIGGIEPGAIAVRYAEHPWGPWSPPQTLLAPGAPDVEDSLYGPGGFLYHPACADTATKSCTRSDPARYSALLNNSCEPEAPSPDYGYLYAAGIIEPYTERTDDGFNVYWTVSSWNPYVTLFVKSHIRATQ
ncbi:MAG TPA: hypothetical protein VMF89_06565, partial [Polyangiales bacterium]|nr:hypothetical protein [Polyangiales bacterium]